MNDKFHLSKNKYSNQYIRFINVKKIKVNNYLGDKLINEKINWPLDS